jgi:hypothetical protein
MTRIRHASDRLDCFYLCVERARQKSTPTLNPLPNRLCVGALSRVATGIRNRADLIAGLTAAGTRLPANRHEQVRYRWCGRTPVHMHDGRTSEGRAIADGAAILGQP